MDYGSDGIPAFTNEAVALGVDLFGTGEEIAPDPRRRSQFRQPATEGLIDVTINHCKSLGKLRP